jgi:hypothetical protein
MHRVNVVMFQCVTVLILVAGSLARCASVESSDRMLYVNIPADGATIQYCGKKYSKEEYLKKKSDELQSFSKTLESKYGLTFKTRSSKYFNIAYRISEQEMNHLQTYLLYFFRHVYPRYFIYEPRQPMRVVYFETKELYVTKTGCDAYGFYQPDSKTLYTYAYSGHGTLWHEMIHAFVDDTIDCSPQQWFNEGFASFYEMSFLDNNAVVEGYTNWRLPQLQEVLRQGRMTPLKRFLSNESMEEEFGYTEARFLFCLLWINNKMEPFVKSYLYEICPKYTGKQRSAMTIKKIESLLGKDIDTIQKEYSDLALKLNKNQKLSQKKS